MQSADILASASISQQHSAISASTTPPEPTQSSSNPSHSPPTATQTDDDQAMAAAAAVSSTPATTQNPQQSQEDAGRQDLPRPYKCPLCDKAFHRLEHQTRHIRTHTGEKPHACQFPGCQKRFSRSDELTRHSRIHSNPNSRRGKAAGNVHAALAFAGPHGHMDGQIPYMLPPGAQPIQYPQTAPPSNLASPNVSPPHHYIPYHTPAYQTPNSYGSYSRSGYDSPLYAQPPQQPTPDRGINLLATAASQVEVERQRQSLSAAPTSAYYPQRNGRHHHAPHHHPYSHHASTSQSPAGSRLPSISAYAYSSNSMSRSSSNEGIHNGHMDDPYAHAIPRKRSRPPSPQYTNPASPNHSGGSCDCSPTPGHTPAMTPAHSPRLRPVDPSSNLQLPGIRSLTLSQQHAQHHANLSVPDTLEPVADVQHNTSHTNLVNSSYATPAPGSAPHSRRASAQGSPTMLSAAPSSIGFGQSRNSSGFRIADIVNHGEAGRTLPVPTMTQGVPSGTSTPHHGGGPGAKTSVQWMLNEPTAAAEADGERMDES